MKKKDFLLAGGVLLLAGVMWMGTAIFAPRNPSRIQITVNGELYGSYPLGEDREIAIGETNVCRISGGKAKMIQANCPDHLCMKQSAVSARGGTIVCLPNRVVIQAVAGEKGDDQQMEELQIDGAVG